MKAGYFTTNMCKQLNYKRRYVSGYKNMESSKKRTKIIRGNKKRKSDKDTQGKLMKLVDFDILIHILLLT